MLRPASIPDSAMMWVVITVMIAKRHPEALPEFMVATMVQLAMDLERNGIGKPL